MPKTIYTYINGAVASSTEVPTYPRILSKTDFNKHCWGTLGMAAFQGILESVRASTAVTTDPAREARATVGQYDSADTFKKDEVLALGTKIKDGGFMSSGQLNAVIDAWPED